MSEVRKIRISSGTKNNTRICNVCKSDISTDPYIRIIEKGTSGYTETDGTQNPISFAGLTTVCRACEEFFHPTICWYKHRLW